GLSGALEPADEETDPEAGPAARRQGEVLLGEGRAGDVEVRPRDAVDEFLEEEPGDDRARLATDVLQVGDAALQFLAILAHERQLPEGLAGRASGGDELVDEPLVVSQDAREERSERDPAGTGEGREVDDRVRLRARRERGRVGAHASPRGIRGAE